jgi:hypothetical protein
MLNDDLSCPFCESHSLTIRSEHDAFGKERVETVCIDCGRKITLDDFRDKVRERKSAARAAP